MHHCLTAGSIMHKAQSHKSQVTRMIKSQRRCRNHTVKVAQVVEILTAFHTSLSFALAGKFLFIYTQYTDLSYATESQGVHCPLIMINTYN